MATDTREYDRSLGIDVEIRTLAVRFAERSADLCGASLLAIAAAAQRRGATCDVQNLPVGFLLELGAVAQLVLWEFQGLRPFLPQDVPTSDDASSQLLERVEQEPGQFLDLKSATLSRQLSKLWLDGFSRFALRSLEADIHLGDLDEDTLVEAVAQLTWKLRHRGSVSSSQETQ